MTTPLATLGDGSSESTRDVVLRAAMAALAANPGASLAEIAAAAGVGRTTVHRIFPTRGDLLRALSLQAVGHLQSALEAARLTDGSASEALARVAEVVMPLADELRFLDAGPEVWNLQELRDAWWSITASLDELVERGQREGDIRGDLPAELVVEAFTGMLWGVWQGVRDGRVAPATAARHAVTMALGGVAARREVGR